MKKFLLLSFVAFTLITLLFLRDKALAASYYEGKTIAIVIGAGPGGGYDRMARILSRYLPKYIPGKPNIIVQNMEGGAGIINANYVYNIAKPDGLTIGALQRGITVGQLTGEEGIRFDFRKFSWIGSAGVETIVLCIRADLPYKSFDDLQKANKLIYMGAVGTTSPDYQFPLLLKEFLGFNVKFIFYPSGSACMLALERKEIDGYAGSYSSYKPYIERGFLRPLLRGMVSEPGIEALPVARDLTNSNMGKTLLTMLAAPDKIGRPYVCPPGTSVDKITILRNAFARAAKDPELQKYAEKLTMKVTYVPADECLEVLKYILNQPDNVVKEFKKFITP